MTSQYAAYTLRVGLARLHARMHTPTRPGTHMHTHHARTRKPAHTNQYVILIAFPQQKWFRKCASILRCTYIACLVTNFSWTPLWWGSYWINVILWKSVTIFYLFSLMLQLLHCFWHTQYEWWWHVPLDKPRKLILFTESLHAFCVTIAFDTINSQAAVLAATFPKPSEYSVVNRTKEVNTQLITKCCEIDFHWIPSHLLKPGNDMVDILAKDTLNLPSLQEPMTY
jgi:hypothetical protein